MISRFWSWLILGIEGLKQRGFLEQGEAEDLQNVGQAPFDPQFLFHDGHEHVDTDGDPDLRLHGIVACAVESFDSQMLLDPLEEQLSVPIIMPPKITLLSS